MSGGDSRGLLWSQDRRSDDAEQAKRSHHTGDRDSHSKTGSGRDVPASAATAERRSRAIFDGIDRLSCQCQCLGSPHLASALLTSDVAPQLRVAREVVSAAGSPSIDTSASNVSAGIVMSCCTGFALSQKAHASSFGRDREVRQCQYWGSLSVANDATKIDDGRRSAVHVESLIRRKRSLCANVIHTGC